MKSLYKLLSFVGINARLDQKECTEEKLPESKPYLFQDNQTVLEEYDDVEIIGTWGCVNSETGESEIKGNLLSKTIKFKDADGSVHIDHKWYPDKE